MNTKTITFPLELLEILEAIAIDELDKLAEMRTDLDDKTEHDVKIPTETIENLDIEIEKIERILDLLNTKENTI